MDKVAFIIESNAVGGAERVLRDVVKYMDASKFDVTIISLFKNSVYGGTSQFTDFFSCKYRWIIDNSNSTKAKVGSFLINRFPNLFYRLFIRTKYNILVAFYEGMPTTFVANLRTSSKKVAWLHTSVDLSISVRKESVLEAKQNVYSAFDRIVGVSNGVRKGFTALFPTLADKVFTAYNPIDSSRIRTLSSEAKDVSISGKFTFVAVGRIIPCKGYERLINVAQKLKEDGWNFVVWIIGGGGGHVRLMELAKEKGVGECFVFYGNQPNPYVYMKKADCVISSSYIEGLSTVLIEGLVLGKLIVATNCNGTEEIIGQNSEWGVLVDNSEDGLYEGMKKVLQNQRMKEDYEQRAILRAEYFDVDHTIEVIEKMLMG